MKRSLPEDQSLSEQNVGITEYMFESDSFQGILKQRYSDFVVNEVGPDGEVVHLTSMAVHLVEEVLVEKPSVLTEALLMQIDTLQSEQFVMVPTADMTKADRQQVHDYIRQNFKNLTTSSKDGNVEVKPGKDVQRRRCAQYTSFTLTKCNRDTMDVVVQICRMIRVPTKVINFAGTKDKRAVTTQRMTIKGVTAQKLAGLNKTLKQQGVLLGDFQYSDKETFLGNQKGNHFHITLRDLKGDRKVIEHNVQLLKQTGFINYFGMQRFGQLPSANHEIGRCIISENYKAAVEAIILGYTDRDTPVVFEARQQVVASNFDVEAMEELESLLHRSCSFELAIIRHLIDSRDFFGALMKLPKQCRSMYQYSYQSYVWNLCVSARIKMSRDVLVGDMVIQKQYDATSPERFNQVMFIQSEEQTKKFTLAHVVMPLVGTQVKLPRNELGQMFRRIMERDGIDPDNMGRKSLELTGDYRCIVVQQQDLEWEIIQYDDLSIPLIQNDFDVMVSSNKVEPILEGQKMALNLKFKLGASQYATMLLRELMKIETGSDYMKELH